MGFQNMSESMHAIDFELNIQSRNVIEKKIPLNIKLKPQHCQNILI